YDSNDFNGYDGDERPAPYANVNGFYDSMDTRFNDGSTARGRDADHGLVSAPQFSSTTNDGYDPFHPSAISSDGGEADPT
ncbi:hypothetical protein EC988_008268, partial [Linderina pennispora]